MPPCLGWVHEAGCAEPRGQGGDWSLEPPPWPLLFPCQAGARGRPGTWEGERKQGKWEWAPGVRGQQGRAGAADSREAESVQGVWGKEQGGGLWRGWGGRKARHHPAATPPRLPVAGSHVTREKGNGRAARRGSARQERPAVNGPERVTPGPGDVGLKASGLSQGPARLPDKIGRPPPCRPLGSPHLPYRPLRLSDPARGGPSSVSCSGSSHSAPQRPAGPGGRFSGGCRTGAWRPGSVVSRGQAAWRPLSAGTSLRLESPKAMHRGSPWARPPPGAPEGGGVPAAGALGSTGCVSHSHTHTHTHTLPLCHTHTHTHTHTAHEGLGRLSHLPEVTEPGSRGTAHPGSAPQPLCLRPGPPDLTEGEDAWLHASPAHTRGCCLPWSPGPSCGC
ncbi:unnamed protein product [Rangifer tarandus platyrhynchus]|uniref:Collagen alpha-1(I) chain-like n=2 Tax=Rangifer tarandus platyrhynchus TaxID=3082113 RepID=A0ABN8ZHN0_RANTA|nr:unnamed protein product [Rangifer tarandus platyrhynchus]